MQQPAPVRSELQTPDRKSAIEQGFSFFPHMPLFPQLYSKEQVFISGRYAFELKRMEKNILRFTNSGGPQDRLALLAFCRDMYAELERERIDLLAREEAWRREWGGKKGQVRALFDAIDTDGSGVIDIDELSQALHQMPDFFGYSDGGTPEGMQEWLKDEVAGAAGGAGVIDLFKRLDADGDGKVRGESRARYHSHGPPRRAEPCRDARSPARSPVRSPARSPLACSPLAPASSARPFASMLSSRPLTRMTMRHWCR